MAAGAPGGGASARGLLGRKVGMTRVFDERGRQFAVTVLQAGPCAVVQQKTPERDGYAAVQVGYGVAKPGRITRPVQGHYRKADLTPRRVLREVRWAGELPAVGTEITVSVFRPGDRVDVVGVSKGKGFAGVIKRHHARRGPMSHGSKYHRRVGSLNSGTSPSRVFKNRQMPGRLGGRRATVSDLEVVRVDADRNMLLLKGGVPGSRGALVLVRTAKKALGAPRAR
jgi:large subunit ribosomal protein L3